MSEHTGLRAERGREFFKLCGSGNDFVFFDAEELIYDPARDPYFLGSEHFARQYVAEPPQHRYRWGV